MSAILLSVKPEFAHAILDGSKTAEVRRRFPAQQLPATLYLYASSPERAIIGTAELTCIERPRSADVWRLYRDTIQISRGSLATYLEDVEDAAILRVDRPSRWAAPLPLADLRLVVGVEPPQSFRYLTDDHVQLIDSWSSASIPIADSDSEGEIALGPLAVTMR